MRTILLVLAAATISGCASAVVGGAGNGSYAREDGREQAVLAEDARISSQVKHLIYRDITLGEADIAVTTRDGIVTLRGRVPNEDALRRAASLARAVDGVRGVNLELTVCAAACN